jgi:hypothetical protein
MATSEAAVVTAAAEQRTRKHSKGDTHAHRAKLESVGATSIDVIMGCLHPLHVLQLQKTSRYFKHVCTGLSAAGSGYWWDVLNLPPEPDR